MEGSKPPRSLLPTACVGPHWLLTTLPTALWLSADERVEVEIAALLRQVPPVAQDPCS